MAFYGFLLGVLATWRVTHFFNAEDGPGDIGARFRTAVGNGFLGSILDCFYCLSVWVAFPTALYLGHSWVERLLLTLALSAGAIIVERATEQKDAA